MASFERTYLVWTWNIPSKLIQWPRSTSLIHPMGSLVVATYDIHNEFLPGGDFYTVCGSFCPTYSKHTRQRKLWTSVNLHQREINMSAGRGAIRNRQWTKTDPQKIVLTKSTHTLTVRGALDFPPVSDHSCVDVICFYMPREAHTYTYTPLVY